ncbi:hypothetical protein E4U52_007844 [Claviceps spartinae]|nr:hypothetical protein E4U52_007844 [Claviceps spartinae]
MDKNELYETCSAERAKSAVLSLKSGKWYPPHSYYSHPCTLNALLKPSIESFWDDLDGLKLDDHNGQKKKSADANSST